MTNFVFKNLPNGFSFPFTRKEIRAYIKGCKVNFSNVSFEGISSSETNSALRAGGTSESRFWVGTVHGNRKNDEWTFSLKINGLRSENLVDIRGEVVSVLIKEIDSWVQAKLSQPLTASEQPNMLFLSFFKKGKKITSACHEARKLD